MSDKTEVVELFLPVGRVINEALFERDVYKDESGKEGQPKYKIELAFDPDDILAEGAFADDVLDAFIAKWGEGVNDDVLDAIDDKGFKGDVRLPFISGDKLAKKREQKGKEGDAYKGKLIIRADTKFNLDGYDGPGGIYVCDEDAEQILPAGRQAIYAGCYGIAAVTLSTWTDEEIGPAVKCYLSGFQKTSDGDKLVSQRDRSEMFKPVGRDKKAGGTKRRSRKG